MIKLHLQTSGQHIPTNYYTQVTRQATTENTNAGSRWVHQRGNTANTDLQNSNTNPRQECQAKHSNSVHTGKTVAKKAKHSLDEIGQILDACRPIQYIYA